MVLRFIFGIILIIKTAFLFSEDVANLERFLLGEVEKSMVIRDFIIFYVV